MKLMIILATVVCSCLGGPYPPSGTRPQGPLLVLPGEYVPPSGQDPRFPSRGDNLLAEETARLMERLRQQQGSERGVYHVYLDDGRLQRVQYTAAPIQSDSQATTEQKQPSDGVYYVNVPEERLGGLRNAQAQQSYPIRSEKISTSLPQRQGSPVRKLASIHVMDVEPIPPPVYSLNPKPLQRIVRQVPVLLF